MSLAFAFIAGLITFIDPCIIATVPVYLGYLAAQPTRSATVDVPGRAVLVEVGPDRAVAPVAVQEADERPVSRWPLVRRSLAFVAGFSSLFLLIGVLVITLGRAMAEWVSWIYIIGAILTILIGLALLGRLVGPLSRLANRLKVLPFIQSPRGAFTLGLAMAVAWIPCIGPIMAVIAAVSSVFAQVGRGVAFLALFCLGLGLPFVAAAFWGEALLSRLRRLGRVATVATAVAGVTMVLIGVLVLTHDGYEALEHRIEDFYHQTIPGAFEWREEAQYEEWWETWFQGGHEEGGE